MNESKKALDMNVKLIGKKYGKTVTPKFIG